MLHLCIHSKNLIKLVMASGKFILEINWNFCNHRTNVKDL